MQVIIIAFLKEILYDSFQNFSTEPIHMLQKWECEILGKGNVSN